MSDWELTVHGRSSQCTMYRICLRRALLIGSLWAVNIVVRPGHCSTRPPPLHINAAGSLSLHSSGVGVPLLTNWTGGSACDPPIPSDHLLSGDAIKDPIRDCCSDCGSVQITVDVDKFRQTSFGIGN